MKKLFLYLCLGLLFSSCCAVDNQNHDIYQLQIGDIAYLKPDSQQVVVVEIIALGGEVKVMTTHQRVFWVRPEIIYKKMK